jgi:hypothetical protein
MLGAFMWLDDPQLLDRIAGFHRACVAFTKQPRMNEAKRARFRDVLDRSRGFPATALPELDGCCRMTTKGKSRSSARRRPRRLSGYPRCGPWGIAALAAVSCLSCTPSYCCLAC